MLRFGGNLPSRVGPVPVLYGSALRVSAFCFHLLSCLLCSGNIVEFNAKRKSQPPPRRSERLKPKAVEAKESAEQEKRNAKTEAKKTAKKESDVPHDPDNEIDAAHNAQVTQPDLAQHEAQQPAEILSEEPAPLADGSQENEAKQAEAGRRRSNIENYNEQRQKLLEKYHKALSSMKHRRGHSYNIGERRMLLMCLLRNFIDLFEAGRNETESFTGASLIRMLSFIFLFFVLQVPDLLVFEGLAGAFHVSLLSLDFVFSQC